MGIGKEVMDMMVLVESYRLADRYFVTDYSGSIVAIFYMIFSLMLIPDHPVHNLVRARIFSAYSVQHFSLPRFNFVLSNVNGNVVHCYRVYCSVLSVQY